jgi:hypothetical protein
VTAHPTLSGFVIIMVIGAGVLNALWNAIAKYVDDRLVAFALMGVVATLAGGLTLLVTGCLPARTSSPTSTCPPPPWPASSSPPPAS